MQKRKNKVARHVSCEKFYTSFYESGIFSSRIEYRGSRIWRCIPAETNLVFISRRIKLNKSLWAGELFLKYQRLCKPFFLNSKMKRYNVRPSFSPRNHFHKLLGVIWHPRDITVKKRSIERPQIIEHFSKKQ